MTDLSSENLKRNLINLHFIKFLLWFMIYMPILIIFLGDNNLSPQQILILHAIGSFCICISEVPTGIIGDILGKKQSIIIGFIFIGLGFASYSISYHFYGFIAAICLISIGQSFISGSDTALLYDTLKYQKKSNAFSKLEGRNVAIGNISESIAFIIGGLLATINTRWPFYIQTGVAFTGILIGLNLVNIKSKTKKISIKSAQLQIKQSFVYSFFKNKYLKNLLLFSSAIGAATLSMAWVVQLYFKDLNFSLVYFGIIGAILNGIISFSAVFTHKLENKARSIITLFLLSFIGIVLGFIIPGIQINPIMLIFLGLFYFSRGIITTLIRTEISHQSPSKFRATILSLKSMYVRISHAILAPFLGFFTDKYSLQTAFMFAGCSVLIFGGYSLLLLFKSFKSRKLWVF